MTRRARGRVPTQLALCHACKSFVKQAEITCPHCDADIAMAAIRNVDRMEQLDRAMHDLKAMLARMGVDDPTSAANGSGR